MRKPENGLTAAWKTVLILLPVAVALVALCIGRIQIPPMDVMKSIWAKVTGTAGLEELTEKTIWQLRMPRIILSALAGTGLSVAGCAFQSLFANPLATPDTLGVASGASFGAALGILLGFKMIGIQVTSLAMGMAAVALTWLCGRGRGRGLSTVVLAGIMIGSLFSALVSLVKFAADAESQLPAITYWLMGGLDRANYRTLAYGAPPIVLAVCILWLLRWRLNLLPLSDDEARSSGARIGLLRTVTVVCATIMTASVVSMCGQVGWVGLLIPHMCRMKFGSDHRALIPASVCLGAAFMICVDTCARSISAAEIPVSILTAIVGAPFFIVLMRKSGGWRL